MKIWPHVEHQAIENEFPVERDNGLLYCNEPSALQYLDVVEIPGVEKACAGKKPTLH